MNTLVSPNNKKLSGQTFLKHQSTLSKRMALILADKKNKSIKYSKDDTSTTNNKKVSTKMLKEVVDDVKANARERSSDLLYSDKEDSLN